MVKKPYNPAACCGAHCAYHGYRENEPCWGDVEISDLYLDAYDDMCQVHTCEGHREYYEGGEYIPQREGDS